MTHSHSLHKGRFLNQSERLTRWLLVAGMPCPVRVRGNRTGEASAGLFQPARLVPDRRGAGCWEVAEELQKGWDGRHSNPHWKKQRKKKKKKKKKNRALVLHCVQGSDQRRTSGKTDSWIICPRCWRKETCCQPRPLWPRYEEPISMLWHAHQYTERLDLSYPKSHFVSHCWE